RSCCEIQVRAVLREQGGTLYGRAMPGPRRSQGSQDLWELMALQLRAWVDRREHHERGGGGPTEPGPLSSRMEACHAPHTRRGGARQASTRSTDSWQSSEWSDPPRL